MSAHVCIQSTSSRSLCCCMLEKIIVDLRSLSWHHATMMLRQCPRSDKDLVPLATVSACKSCLSGFLDWPRAYTRLLSCDRECRPETKASHHVGFVEEHGLA